MFEGDRRGKLSFLPNRCVCIAYSCGYLGEYCQILLRFEIGKRLKSKCRGRCPYRQETNSSSTYKKPGRPRLLIPRGGPLKLPASAQCKSHPSTPAAIS